jgi:chitinase
VNIRNDLPAAVILATPQSGKAPLRVQFSSDGSNDPDGTIVSYGWVFGDGTTSTLANPTHIYNNRGSYIASLTVTDNLGGSDSEQLTITVQETNRPPVADITVQTQTVTSVLTPVQFNSSGSNDPDGTIISYSWDFGDGKTSTLANPTHTFYNTPWWEDKQYRVTLTITDNDQTSSTDTLTINVSKLPGYWR